MAYTSKINLIDYFIDATIQNHPDSHIIDNFAFFIYPEVGYSYITSKDNARKIAKQFSQEDIVNEIIIQLKKFKDLSMALPKNILTRDLDLINACTDLLNVIEKENNPVNFLLLNPKILKPCANLFAYLRYGPDLELSKIVRKDKVDEIRIPDVGPFRNIVIQPSTLNRCRSDVLNGSQFVQKRNEYSLGGSLYAVSDMGNIRKNQEDSVLILTHPKNSNFKFLMVADGMGGMDAGEEASSYITKRMLEWFESINVSYYENTNDLEEQFKNILNQINDELCEKFMSEGKRGGSTFVGAIIGKYNTLLCNIGDSRGYILKNGELKQVTEDNSVGYSLYKAGEVRKDDIRFLRNSNVITKCMGYSTDELYPSVKILKNDYDRLILFTDGIWDSLSDDKIKVITKRTGPKELAGALVDSALSTDSYLRKDITNTSEFKSFIPSGHDNATVAVYNNEEIKRR